MSSYPPPMLTLSHQYGSGGSLIAQELGRRLQWTVWDKEILRHIATQELREEGYVEAKDERIDTFIERVVRILGMGRFETTYGVLPPFRLTDSQLVQMIQTTIENGAKEGGVIVVGRGGNHILAGRPNTLHVFVYAPLEVRIDRVMRVEGLSRADAESRIIAMDRLRSDYVRHFYHADWYDPRHYHLLLDSAMWGETGTADIITGALELMSSSIGDERHRVARAGERASISPS
jgi:cytidylate kinase